MHAVADCTSGCIAALFCWAERGAGAPIVSGPVAMVRTSATTASGAGTIEISFNPGNGFSHLLIDAEATSMPNLAQSSRFFEEIRTLWDAGNTVPEMGP